MSTIPMSGLPNPLLLRRALGELSNNTNNTLGENTKKLFNEYLSGCNPNGNIAALQNLGRAKAGFFGRVFEEHHGLTIGRVTDAVDVVKYLTFNIKNIENGVAGEKFDTQQVKDFVLVCRDVMSRFGGKGVPFSEKILEIGRILGAIDKQE